MNNLSIDLSIQNLLKELQQLVLELQNDPVDVSQLELDIMKEKIRTIYDILNNVEIMKVTIQRPEEEIITQPEPEIEIVQDEEQVTETVPEFDIKKEKETAIEFEISSHEDEKQAPTSSEPTLDLFEEPVSKSNDIDKKSVGEKIAEEKPVESIGEAIQSKKIVSLKLAIGINEKFFFLNELFDGKMNEYNEFIEELDQKETLKDAQEHLDLKKDDKSWNEESEAFLQLKGFLERKFN